MAEPTEGAKDIAKVATNHWLWAAIFVAGIAFLVVRSYARIATAARKHPKWAKAMNIPVACFAFVVAGLLAVDASAATCCSAPVAAAAGSGLGGIVLAVLAAASGAISFGMVGLGTPDAVDCKTANGQKSVSFDMDDATVDPSVDFFVDGSQNLDPITRRPLVVLDDVIELTSTANNPFSTGTNPIYDDDRARELASLQITNPIVGTVLDQTSGTGPFVKLVMEFFGLGFNRGDIPVATLLVPGAGVASATETRSFTIPRAQRFLPRPSRTAPWLALWHNTDLRISLAKKAVALNGVSTGATISGTSTVKVSSIYAAAHDWEAPMIARYWRETPVGGSNATTLRRFGEADPAGTIPTDMLFLIAQLSSLKGLGGNQTLDQITQIDVPKLNLARVENIGNFVKARIDAQYGNAKGVRNLDGNYQMGAAVDGINAADLLFLALKQPGHKMAMESLLEAKSGSELAITESLAGANPSGQYAFALGSLRHLNNTALAQLVALSGGRVKADRGRTKAGV